MRSICSISFFIVLIAQTYSRIIGDCGVDLYIVIVEEKEDCKLVRVDLHGTIFTYDRRMRSGYKLHVQYEMNSIV